MPTWLITLIVSAGVTAWVYNYLARNNGNASPTSNLTLAAIAGAVFFLVIFTLLKFTFGL